MARSLVVLLSALAATYAVKAPESGYLLTAPKVLQAGTDERACIRLFHLPGPNRAINLKFFERGVPKSVSSTLSDAEPLLFETSISIPDFAHPDREYCFNISIPSDVTHHSADLLMKLTAGAYNDRTWVEKSTVALKPEKFLTLVQTNKAKYQPGQKVLFRVLTLDHDLYALNHDLEEVWITTSNNIRVAQWKDVSVNTGMVQLEMQLTEEPPLGRWTIHVKTFNEKITKQFSVEEYVLPTFEVKVEAPNTMGYNEKTITAKVCAEYTFGKPLIGANITIRESYRFPHHTGIFDHQLSDEEGCAIFDLIVGGGHSYGLNLNVTVEEAGTGLMQYETKYVSRTRSSIRLSKVDNSQMDFKPKLPFYGKYKLTSGDDQPVKGEIIKVCYTAKYRDRAVSSDENRLIPDDPVYRAAKKYKEHVQNEFGYTPFFWETKSPSHVITNGECREYRTDDNGRIVYYIPPQAEDIDSVNIEASSTVVESWRNAHDQLTAFFSPSHSYLSIDASDLPEKLPCSSDVTVKLLSTAEEKPTPVRAYKVMSRGRIILTGYSSGNHLTIPASLFAGTGSSRQPQSPHRRRRKRTSPPRPMPYDFGRIRVYDQGPEFKLLVYYVKDSGEVVSDSRVFQVDKCLPNTVQVSWDQKQVKPGDSASFTVRAAPNSVCGISAVDRSTELLGTSNQITLDTVFKKLREFIIRRDQEPDQVTDTEEYCNKTETSLLETLRRGGATESELAAVAPTEENALRYRREASMPLLPHYGRFDPSLRNGGRYTPGYDMGKFHTRRHDAIKPFNDAGFLIITNLAVETRPCYKRVPAKKSSEELHSGSGYAALIRPSFAAGGSFVGEVIGYSGSSEHRRQPVMNSRAGSAGIFPSGPAGSPGVTGPRPPPSVTAQEEQLRESFKEDFLFSVETLDAYGVKTLTSKLPDTITSWVGSAICTSSKVGLGISNKTSITTFKPFFIKMSLPYSVKRGELLDTSASVFNFLDSSLSVKLDIAPSEQYKVHSAVSYGLCIAPGMTEVRHFLLDFVGLWEVNITLTARAQDGYCQQANTVAPGSDTVIKPVIIKPEGFPQEVTTSRFICLEEGEEYHEETMELPVPEGLVSGSERAFFSVVGDLLGPTYEGLERGLIDSPTGAGEPNMITLVPNIYIRHYLERTNQLTEKQKRQTNSNMQSGYQRQVRFRRSDGSFSSYGMDDYDGSLWLTAFVVKSLKEADKYVPIDKELLKQAKDWILKHMDHTSGCFPRVGEVIHKEMKGGTERGGEAALTAFVMLAVKDPMNPTQLNDGVRCLDNGLLLPNRTLYSEILIAHAYLKTGQTAKGEALVERLMGKAQRRGNAILYWEGDRSSIFGGSRAVDVEMTAYMVLSLLHISGVGYLEEVARAVRWINTQRNCRGGFYSTQDTIVAVEALTEFAIRTFASDLSTTVAVTAGGATVWRFVDFADCLAWLFAQHSGNEAIRHYLDDFFAIGPQGSDACHRAYRSFLEGSQQLGVPLAPRKCVPPAKTPRHDRKHQNPSCHI